MTKYKCQYCPLEFTAQKTLKSHLRQKHIAEFSITRKVSIIICPLCTIKLVYYKDLRNHLASAHNIEIKTEEKTFRSREAFMTWKYEIEKKLKCHYNKRAGRRSHLYNNKDYFVCHRSYRPEKVPIHSNDLKKKRKSLGSAKLSYTCPSTLEMTECDGEIYVVLYLPHVGHDCDVKSVKLHDLERKQIAEKLAAGLSFDEILSEVKESLKQSDSIERVHLLQRQDLRNIKRSLNLSAYMQQKSDLQDKVSLLYNFIRDTTMASDDLTVLTQEIDNILERLEQERIKATNRKLEKTVMNSKISPGQEKEFSQRNQIILQISHDHDYF